MGLEIRHLHAFVTVADQGSMSKAAQTLHIGQPSLSRTIAQLEKSLGYVLLERSAAGCRPTEKGDVFLARARRAIREFEMAVEHDDAFRVLTVGYVWSVLGRHTNDIFRHWDSVNTEDRLALRRFHDSSAGVDSGKAAFGIVRHRTPDIKHRRIVFTENRVAALAEGHPLADSRMMSLAQFADEVIVINTVSGTTGLSLWESSIRPSKSPIEVSSIDEWNTIVSLGQGVGVTPESTSVMHPYPGIRYVPIADAPLVPVYVIWQQNLYTELCNRFADVASTVAQFGGLPTPAAPR